MTSLAYSAAPFTNNNEDKPKKRIKNKLKKHKFHSEPVFHANYQDAYQSTHVEPLETVANPAVEQVRNIHNPYKIDEDDNESLFDFQPPENPVSASSEKLNRYELDMKSSGPTQEGFVNDTIDDNVVENDEEIQGTYAKQYYQQYQPDRVMKEYKSLTSTPQDDTANKLNYLIQLLEDQKDQKMDNINEEMVLYSFLGIFMIYVVDSFVRVGKYVR